MIKYLLKVTNDLFILKSYTQVKLAQYQGSKGHNATSDVATDTDKCYKRINHIIMSFLLLAMVGTMGPIVSMLHAIQAMKFYQCMARGDLTTFMGGRGKLCWQSRMLAG
jgi:hypothetical protein